MPVSFVRKTPAYPSLMPPTILTHLFAVGTGFQIPLYHTDRETQEAKDFFIQAFSKKEIPDQVDTLSVPCEQGKLSDYIPLLAAAGYAASGSELRRMTAQGGIRKNGIQIGSVDEIVCAGDVLRIGKRKFVKLTFQPQFLAGTRL